MGRPRTTVHPRACGEHQSYTIGGRSMTGSSPRVRGTLVVPACPRGSSPRVRGTRPGRRSLHRGVRFIPARAGNTPAAPARSSALAVHPRACGEHRVVHITDEQAMRFIPARAGNTCARRTPTSCSSVHPRACGEHWFISTPAGAGYGSSPRVRGTRAAAAACHRRSRFIPARAGNTPRPRASWCAPSVHPRACGEHSTSMGSEAHVSGSSPRVRGTRDRRHRRRAVHRFIPARAGNTSTTSTWRQLSAVHPRACGEHTAYELVSTAGSGSSPRVRGTRKGQHQRHAVDRFIPARAGNTLLLSY